MTTFIFLLPLLQLALLAQATGQRIGNLRLAVLDLDGSAASRQLVASLDNREELQVRCFVLDEAQLRELLDRGRVDAGVILPRGLAQDLLDVGRTAQVQVVVDGSNSVVGSIALSAANAAILDGVHGWLRAEAPAAGPLIDLQVATYYNPTSNIRHFTIPAQVGFITYQIALAVAALSLARERELGTLEQLIVSPIARLELVLGKAIPAFIIGVFNFLLMLGVAVHFFQVPLRGSLWLLLAITMLFVAAVVGWGLLISATARNPVSYTHLTLPTIYSV